MKDSISTAYQEKEKELNEKLSSGIFTQEQYDFWFAFWFPKNNPHLQKIAKEFRLKSQLNR